MVDRNTIRHGIPWNDDDAKPQQPHRALCCTVFARKSRIVLGMSHSNFQLRVLHICRKPRPLSAP